MKQDDNVCPVCGYDALPHQAWVEGTPSGETCPSCGIRFGIDDAAPEVDDRQRIWSRWQERWVIDGAKWSSRELAPPTGWNPHQQFENLNIQSESPPETLWICPVCGYDDFDEPTWRAGSSGSLDICPSCGTQFGYDDAAGGSQERRAKVWSQLRERWKANGCKWWAEDDVPDNWNPEKQLENLKQIQ